MRKAYIADDGTSFDYEDECMAYEAINWDATRDKVHSFLYAHGYEDEYHNPVIGVDELVKLLKDHAAYPDKIPNLSDLIVRNA